jgi:uncharacterized membrane protein
LEKSIRMESSASNSAFDEREARHAHKAAWGAMLAGTALSIYGWTRKSATGAALGMAGGAIALKAASAGPIADLVGTETAVSYSVTIMCNAAEVYALWNNESRIPQWMNGIQSVARLADGGMQWVRVHPVSGTLTWRTDVPEDIPDRSIRWRARLDQESRHGYLGELQLSDLGANRGTLVTLRYSYEVHTGIMHAGAPYILGPDPQREVRENLRRFKMLIEAGEIATIHGQSHGPRTLKGKLLDTLMREDAA